LINNKNNNNDNVEEIILDLESRLNIKFRNKQRQLIEYIATLNFKKVGVTVKKLCFKFNYKKDYAEKKIHELKNYKILKSSGIRDGHMLTYFLANMQDYIPLPEDFEDDNKENLSGHKKSYDIDQDMIMTLCKMITNNPGGFHDIRLHTRLIYKEDYDRLVLAGESRWYIKSDKNKAKVKEIRLSPFRTAKLQVYPNGTVEIYLGASRDPYSIYKDTGLSEFMVDLGKIESNFQADLSISNPLEHFLKWCIIRLDYNYDVTNLKSSYLANSRGKLQVKDLTGLYQFYVKVLPREGPALRCEKRFSFPKPYPTVNEFMRIIQNKQF
jgi:hypothetical protein